MQTTSQTTSFLAEPSGEERIPASTLGYVTEMAREEVFDMLAAACVEAGVPRNHIAKRLGKEPAQISRMLNSPGNFTIDTIAQTLFAINGNMFRLEPYSPLREPKSNARDSYCDVRVSSRSDTFVVWGEALTPIRACNTKPHDLCVSASTSHKATRSWGRGRNLVRVRA